MTMYTLSFALGLIVVMPGVDGVLVQGVVHGSFCGVAGLYPCEHMGKECAVV